MFWIGVAVGFISGVVSLAVAACAMTSGDFDE